ncbi:MAG: inorganic diphosphatase [Gammaproteobacteria bacterium]|nr:inorganic diphosphatase [Gammaproteobacteria bacterium]
MSLNNLPSGDDAPRVIGVVIESPLHGSRVKYEVENDNGTLMQDRFTDTAVFCPCNYGVLPDRLFKDSYPVDVSVTEGPMISASVNRCHPLEMLEMANEAGGDYKVLAVSVSKLNKLYNDMLSRITHFFEQYKTLETGKWAKVENRPGVNRHMKNYPGVSGVIIANLLKCKKVNIQGAVTD